MGQFHWDPESYLELMRSEVPDYERLQDEVARACARAMAPGSPSRIQMMLELGTGTGETARRVLAVHPEARMIGIDGSERMLAVARGALGSHGPAVELRVRQLEEPLPGGPFDLVFSALAVHHLDGPRKAELFERVAAGLSPGGRFVLGDVVVPVDPADAVTPIDDDGYDTPSTVAAQLAWLSAAGFDARVAWTHRDLAVLVGEKRSSARPDPS
jgi:tRNA (cmo5U34)-methyltransferase